MPTLVLIRITSLLLRQLLTHNSKNGGCGPPPHPSCPQRCLSLTSLMLCCLANQFSLIAGAGGESRHFCWLVVVEPESVYGVVARHTRGGSNFPHDLREFGKAWMFFCPKPVSVRESLLACLVPPSSDFSRCPCSARLQFSGVLLKEPQSNRQFMSCGQR